MIHVFDQEVGPSLKGGPSELKVKRMCYPLKPPWIQNPNEGSDRETQREENVLMVLLIKLSKDD